MGSQLVDNVSRLSFRPVLAIYAGVLLLSAGGAAGDTPQLESGVFPQVAKLTASDAAAGDEFGWEVDIDGAFAIVGAPGANGLGSDSGAAFVFERNAGGPDAWGQVASLLAPDGEAGDSFGWGVAISGNTALVGAPGPTGAPGSAYVFDHDPATGEWEYSATLTAGEPNDNFGTSVDLQGDYAVVGAPQTDGPGGDDGAAFIHERDAGGPGAWSQVAKLVPAVECDEQPTWCGFRGEHSFSSTIALDGDLVLAGGGGIAAGFTYVFHCTEVDPAACRRVARPTPTDFSSGQQYSDALALAGQTLLVGAYADRELGPPGVGAAYIFERDPGGPSPWTEVKKLFAPNWGEDDWFGRSVGITANLAVVGASQQTRPGPGYAWVFERDLGGDEQWGALTELLADDGQNGDDFGDAAAVDGETVIVGAPGESSFGTSSGAAYIFERTRGLATRADIRPSALVAEPSEFPWPAMKGLSGAVSLVPSAPGALHDGLGTAAPTPIFPPERDSPRKSRQASCFDFTFSVCDGLELSVSDGTVTGLWRNSDCEGTDVPISGTVQSGRGLVRCDAGAAPCPAGSTWGWIIDLPLDGSMDMLRHQDGLWQNWIDEITYTTIDGECSL